MGGRGSGRESAWYTRTDWTEGMSSEQKAAAEALKALRRASAMADATPFRARTLAEAEAHAPMIPAGETPPAVMREQGLTVKHRPITRRI